MYKGRDRRGNLPGRRLSDSGTCLYHEDMEELIKGTVSWKVFVWVVGMVTMITMAYIGFAQVQHDNAYRKAEDAIERTHLNKERLIGVEIRQRAVLTNIEKLMRSSGVEPAITSGEVEKEIKNED